MAMVEGRPRARFGRIVILGSLLCLAAGLGMFWPRIWAAATTPGGALVRAKRKFDLWRGLAQGSDPRIRRLVRTIDAKPKPGASGGGVKTVTRY